MDNSSKFTLRLRPSIVLLFLMLSLPLFIATVWMGYTTNESIARDTANQLIEKTRFETISSANALLKPVESLVTAAAALSELEPDFFRQERAASYLTGLMKQSHDISSVYVAFSDGSFRMSMRVVPGVRIQERTPPDGAYLVTRWLNRKVNGTPQDRYVFLDINGRVLGYFDAAASYDPRERAWYKESALARGQLSISDVYFFASTGLLGNTISMPFYVDEKLAGVVAADITLASLSKFLAARPVSAGSLSLIVDENDRIVAHPDPLQAIWREDGLLQQNRLSRLENKLPALAVASRPDVNSEQFNFTDVKDGQQYVAMFAKFPASVGKAWRVMIIAPMADFSRKATESNRRLLLFGAAVVLLQIILIYLLSVQIARPIEQLETQIKAVQNFVSTPAGQIRSNILEIKSLIHAVDTLDYTIHAFSSFVPKGLVQQLLNSSQRLELGGSSRFLTIVFTDIEAFSTLAETSPAHELLMRVSAYLEAVTVAVNQEQGTIDKFIGDGVMAFWGAPAVLQNHAYHACVAALRVQNSMRKLNQQWALEGLRPLNVRVGIHSDSVLVGNIGSTERMSYTVMGDGVNLAARLEGTNKEFGTKICVSQAVFKEAGERLWVRPISLVTVKGRRSDMEIYELLGIRGGEPELEATPEQIRLCEMTRRAYAAFSQGDITTARQRYEEMSREFPADPLCRAMLELCEKRSPSA